MEIQAQLSHRDGASEPNRWPAVRALVTVIILIGFAGCAASSNRLPANALKVEISDAPLTAKFINSGDVPVRILKPLDGSESCWIMPYYKLTVIDQRGKEICRSARCDVYGYPWSGTRWPDDYLITIPAYGSFAVPIRCNHDIPATGLYTISFQYIFKPTTQRIPGGRYPSHLWRGEVASNRIEARLEATKRE